MLSQRFKLFLNMLFAPRMKIDRSEHTPIYFDEYDHSSCYYLINNNKNQIYSVDEIYELLQKNDKIDPFTRLPIVACTLVKISFNR